MKLGRRIAAIIMIVLMLLTMAPTAMAEVPCKHNWQIDYEVCPGYYYFRYCPECGAEEELPGGQHNGTWEWQRYPTCTENGMQIFFCQNDGCGFVDEREIPPSHNWGDWYKIGDADCQHPGMEERTCGNCGATETRTSSYGEHKWGSWYTSEKGDCTHPGKESRTCSVCGATETRTAEEGSHKWGSWKTLQEASCTEGGKEERKCSLCGKEQTRNSDPLGHQWGEWVVIQEPAYPEPGIRERECGRCGLVEREEYYPEGSITSGTSDDETVKKVQEELNNNGYASGTPDGDFGPNTGNAWTQWQEDNGFIADGVMWADQIDVILGRQPENNDQNSGEEGVTFVKYANNPPANGEYYVPGEQIEYYMEFVIPEGYVACDIEISDPMKGGNEDSVVCREPELSGIGGNGWVSGKFVHVVTVEEAEVGVLVNTATATWWNPDAQQQYTLTASVEVPVGLGEVSYGTVDVQKKVVGSPANGEYYELGETIYFKIDVNIATGEPLNHLAVIDEVNGSTEGSVLAIMPTAHGEYAYDYEYVVTEEDVARGYVANAALVYFFDPEGDAWVEVYSNTVVVPTRSATPITDGAYTFTKTLASTPANGSYFVPGEVVEYELEFANNSGHDLGEVTLYDMLDSNFNSYSANVYTGNMFYQRVYYEVTVEDAERGYVTNVAEAYWLDPNSTNMLNCFSNPVTIPCGYKYLYVDGGFITGTVIPGETVITGTVALGGLSISKAAVSTPANGQFYVPGETVSYSITVKNTGGLPLYDVAVRDNLYSSYDPVAVFANMNPGEEFTTSFTYTLSDIDAISGEKSNIASAVGYDPEGKAQAAISNMVTVPTGAEGGFGVITDMAIVKEETSAPANGTYYTEGETISYKITYTNAGETPFGETLIYDSLNADGYEIASAEKLEPGESRYCTFSYVVTAEDVAKGYVANSAIAKYDIGGGYTNTAISNVVVSDTDGDPNTTYVPGAGKVDWTKIRGTDGAQEDTCYIKAIYRGGDIVDYEVHFCSKHEQTQNAVMLMAGEASDVNQQQMVWEYASALWQQEVNAMYDMILLAGDDDAKITIMSERVSYLAMVANTYYSMKIANPDNPQETAHAVSDFWQYKCIDLCYLMNTAPAERVDSIFDVERTQAAVEINENCTCEINEEAADKILLTDKYCTDHGFTYEMMELILVNGSTIGNWATVRSLWEIELEMVYNELYKDASEEGGVAYLAEYAAYINWLPLYEQFLTMAYPENPEIVAEMMVNTIMARTLDACNR